MVEAGESLCVAVLGQSRGPSFSDGGAVGLVVLGVLACVIISVSFYLSKRAEVKKIELMHAEMQVQRDSTQQSAEREQKAYTQHIALNDLTAEKVKLESQYLQLQMKIGKLDIEHRERVEEYQRLMSDKTRLEIQSLKLHIREQTKRLDDFGSYDEE